MNVLEKAEKALEFLKAHENSPKSHELQTAAATLGRCMGALGSRSNCAKHYANLLHSAAPTLLQLASNDSAEIRLVGDEALNRAVVGGFAFHSHKTNIILQNQIDHSKNARWIRAALSRICLGDSWLRPGVGKIRTQAQTLFPKLSRIVWNTNEIPLIVEALESNLPRILTALAEYTTDEEISELSKALLSHVETPDPAVRRGISTCVAHLCSHREPLLTNVLSKVFEKLWPLSTDSAVITGWFSVIKAIFQINGIAKFQESDSFGLQDYLELYHLCVHYIESSTDHNVQNTVMECFTIILSLATGHYKTALLDKHPDFMSLDDRQSEKGHRRNISTSSVISTRYAPSPQSECRDQLELSFSGALQLGSILQINTPSLSVEDLTIKTPDSPASGTDIELPNAEQLTRDLSEKLQEYEEEQTEQVEKESETVDHGAAVTLSSLKVNIGTSSDDDIPLKYCARLLASKFLLTGNKGCIIPDRSVRVSLKSSALHCLSEILRLYPQAVTLYLDKNADKSHNISGSSEGTESNQDQIHDFVLERNVCYQDSLTDSLCQDILNRSIDSQQTTPSQLISKKESSKDVPSNILDSKIFPKELATSATTDSTNMTNSNFTMNSNMTGSNDPLSTGYPMSSSGDVLSSSIDLDMKFDHFGESTTNLDNLDALRDFEKKDEKKRPLKRTEEVTSKDEAEILDDLKDHAMDTSENFEFQHLSDVFLLLEGHNDPQIRGLVRICIGNYLVSSLDVSHGDYNRWRSFSMLTKDVSENITIDKLINIVIKGLSDEIHSTVNHTLSALTILTTSLCNSAHWPSVVDILNALVNVEGNRYWLCRVNLCKMYDKLPYLKLFMLYPLYYVRSKLIMDTLVRLLNDQDQKVRHAAAQTIANIIPYIYASKKESPTSMVADIARDHSKQFSFTIDGLSLDLVRDIYFYSDIPMQMKKGDVLKQNDYLSFIVGDLMGKLMASNCKYYSQGLLEALQAICKRWSPWKHMEAYSSHGILAYCLDNLDYCNGTPVIRTMLIDLCTMIYPVEIHNIMRHKTTNRDIFERDSDNKDRWQHLDDATTAVLAEKFLQVTLKMLNVLVHLIEEVNPNVHLNKGGIALPGSPVRRKTTDSIPRRGSNPSEGDEKGSLRKKPLLPATSLKANFAGHFFNEPFYMKFYESLRATYSNHKINLDPKSSIFHAFLSTVLNALSVQLELATENEIGNVTEEILFYLKSIMPLCPDLSVYCITQLLKCLFGTNMVNQYTDFMSIFDKVTPGGGTSFYQDVMLVNTLPELVDESRRSSVCSNASQKLALDCKNPRMAQERQMLITMENFAKNKSDRKWSTNKKELERYIRLFEPVVIQALKSYTMQNDIPLQCQVLSLLKQLLTLRVNYCMLDSEQIFIGFLMKQLDLVEQHEIPECCDLVNSILMFLVQLSSSKHHTKQIIEIPKLIQLCDGLMASGAHAECTAGLEPVAVRVFSNMNGASVLGRAQQQEAQATREVLFYMLQKTMHQPKVVSLVSCVLSLSQDHPESLYRWSELAADTLLNLLAQRSMELDSVEAIGALERLIDNVYRDVLLEQSRVEILLKTLFKAPPEQETTPLKLKLRYLAVVMILLRKILVLIPESEILLTINYLKATFVSPQSIFFNVKTDVDPLNVQNVNENCANLSPDVILVRLLFKTLTYAILELDKCYEDLEGSSENKLLYLLCVNIVVHVKHMMHLTEGCLFPLTAKTAQTLLHNEQSGLNTGLYCPEENIPLDKLNIVCLKSAHRIPMLTVHWSHLLIRLNFLSHKYWQKLIGFARNLPLSADGGDTQLLRVDVLQIACVMAYCEYFVENGLTEAVHLTWLLVNRVHILVSQYRERIVQELIAKVQQNAAASALLLQAVASRCQPCLKDEFALNTYKILSQCHENQSGALVFFICRVIGKLEPAVAVRYAKLATDRCKTLKEMPVVKISELLSKEDVQVALELLQRDKVHTRYSDLVMELNSVASTVFDLSPLDLSQERAINPQYIETTNVDGTWLLNQVKNRCCRTDCSYKNSNNLEIAQLLSNLPQEDLLTVMACPEFDRKLLNPCFKICCDNYIREILNIISVRETKETEKEFAREQRELKMREEMTSSIDSNKLNVANTLHVFKKSENKESKSQFFIPITESENFKENFGNLQISDDDMEIELPELPDLYKSSIATLEKSLTEVIRLFPKQVRPLSQSENFNLNVEQTIDRYTRRCHQVFQDKLFYQEFITLQTVMTGFLSCIDRLIAFIDETDCDLIDKYIENILPSTLSRNISIFAVISLQYLSFLIKNKRVVETPVHTDVSFRVNATVADNIVVDNVIRVTMENVARALSFKEIWTELNVDANVNRTQSAISCLYAIVKYLVKDTKPITPKQYMQYQDSGPRPDMIITGDKLIALIEYWEQHFYAKPNGDYLAKCYIEPIQSLLVSLSRLDIMSNIALIPPIAWSSVDVTTKKDQLQKIDLPLHALLDLDVLEAFLFRMNLIGWSSKKQFEEMWVGLLGALQGNGTHWAVVGIAQLLVSAAPRVRRRGLLHTPRSTPAMTEGMQRLRNILVGTSSYKIFDKVNLERIPLMNDGFDGYHYAQFNTDYLKLASDITDDVSQKMRREVKRVARNKDIDINSCLQILMDVTSQMLEPNARTGLAARAALITLTSRASCAFSTPAHWCWAASLLSTLTAVPHATLTQYACVAKALLVALSRCVTVLRGYDGLQELSSVHARLGKSLTSSYAPLRQAALHGCLLQPPPLATQLAATVTAHLANTHKISLYEQSLYWTVLFTLVELGHTDLMNIAVDFVLNHPRHYCVDLVVRGITSMIRQQVLPKDLKNIIIEKLLDNMNNYSEEHAVQIMMVHLFAADNKLLSPKLTSDVSNMDPDILMNSMERITLLYKVLRNSSLRETKRIISTTLQYFLRETLPPAATLSRVVIECVESCKESERSRVELCADREGRVDLTVVNADVVFEVFQTSITQDQLPVLSGWIFEALCHLLNGKITEHLLPYCVLTLLISASSNPYIRQTAPLASHILRIGLKKNVQVSEAWGIFRGYLENLGGMSFSDRRLLCVVATKSNFTKGQMERLKELCDSNVCLQDLGQCIG